MADENYIEFRNGSRIYFSGAPGEGNRLRGAGDEGGDYLRRGTRDASCKITIRLDPEETRRGVLPTEFDFDEREPDGSVLLGGR